MTHNTLYNFLVARATGAILIFGLQYFSKGVSVDEQRRFSRVPFRTLAAVKSLDGTMEMEGEVKNISLAGMLLDCDNSMPVGTWMNVEIFLAEGNPEFEIRVKGKVVRVTKDGSAIQFSLDGIPFESLTHLRYVVSYNLGDDDTVMAEFFHHIDTDMPFSPLKDTES